MPLTDILGTIRKNPLQTAGLGASLIGDIFGNRGAARTSTSTPTVAPAYSGLQDMLRQRVTQRLSSPIDMAGMEASGIQNINDAFGGAKAALDNSLTSRGLGTSPTAGYGDLNFQQKRAGTLAQFLNELPYRQRDMENQDLALGSNLIQQNQGQQNVGAGSPVGTAASGIGYVLGKIASERGENLIGTGLSGLLGGLGGGGGAGLTGAAVLPGIQSTAMGVGNSMLAGMGITPTAGAAGAAGASGGVSGVLGLGGGSGLFGLGAATIPVIGGIVAGGLLASKLIGRGRKAADVLTQPGGMQNEFEQVLRQIDAEPGLTAQQRWAAKEAEYDALVKMGLEHAQQGAKQRLVVTQMFDEISPLFRRPNPLRG